MKKVYKIRGLSCAHCKEKIEETLQQMEGIAKVKVSLKDQSIFLDYREDVLTMLQINEILREDGYEIYESTQDSKEREAKPWMLLLLAGTLFFLLNHLVPDLSTMLAAGNSLSVAMLFVIGITTSFHCVSMCGGIAISHVVKDKNIGKRTILYNLGRVISYTLLGGIVGAIGSGITLGNRFFSVVPIVLGSMMILMGLTNAGILSWNRVLLFRRWSGKFTVIQNKLSGDHGPFVLGLANGLMPCGPLQLMQIYALSTGSFTKGALSMFAFSLGTVPLMVGLGYLVNRLSVSRKTMVYRLGGYLVILLGMGMMLNGITTAGFSGIKQNTQNVNVGTSVDESDEVQEVLIQADYRSYEDITVKKGIPVKLTIDVPPGKLNGCNYAMYLPEYDVFSPLTEGKNVIEFLPEQTGTYSYSCWMGMIRNKITVVE